MTAFNAPILPSFSPIGVHAITHSADILSATKVTHAPFFAVSLTPIAINAPIPLSFSPIKTIVNDEVNTYNPDFDTGTTIVHIPSFVFNAPNRFAPEYKKNK